MCDKENNEPETEILEGYFSIVIAGTTYQECPDCKGSMRAIGHTDHYDD